MNMQPQEPHQLPILSEPLPWRPETDTIRKYIWQRLQNYFILPHQMRRPPWTEPWQQYLLQRQHQDLQLCEPPQQGSEQRHPR